MIECGEEFDSKRRAEAIEMQDAGAKFQLFDSDEWVNGFYSFVEKKKYRRHPECKYRPFVPIERGEVFSSHRRADALQMQKDGCVFQVKAWLWEASDRPFDFRPDEVYRRDPDCPCVLYGQKEKTLDERLQELEDKYSGLRFAHVVREDGSFDSVAAIPGGSKCFFSHDKHGMEKESLELNNSTVNLILSLSQAIGSL